MKKQGSKTNQGTAIAAWFQKAFSLELPHLGTAFTILMEASLHDRNAIRHFLGIAHKLPAIRFRLVLQEAINDDVILNHIGILPANCLVYGTQQDHLPFYEEAHIVLHLSTHGEGSTISDRSIPESMACARPVIVPEGEDKFSMITDGQEGFHINPDDGNRLLTVIRELCSDANTYFRISVAAREKMQHGATKLMGY
jgi:glycosyltransferase involved in cell wall biosynthesis